MEGPPKETTKTRLPPMSTMSFLKRLNMSVAHMLLWDPRALELKPPGQFLPHPPSSWLFAASMQAGEWLPLVKDWICPGV